MSEPHFPAEFPKECILDLAKIVMRRDPAALISPETTDHALYAAGCFNAMRFDLPRPVGAWWTPLLPIAQALIIKIITEYLSQPAPAFAADADLADYSGYTLEQCASELEAKLAA
jgi:hypothetical protein